MSALPPKADIDQDGRDVRFVLKADISLDVHVSASASFSTMLRLRSVPQR
jgi:hypothetical protein